MAGKLGDVFRVAQTVSDHARGHDYGSEIVQLLVAHILKALLALQGSLVLVAEKRQRRLAPEAAHQMEVCIFLGKAMLVVSDLGLVVVAFNENSDLLSVQLHGDSAACRI